MRRIAIVDYGMGNLPNVRKAVLRAAREVEAGPAGAAWDAVITDRPEDVAAADAVILPGVGAFPAAMAALGRTGLGEAVQAAARAGRPLLGICLGQQLLFEASEEWERTPGLGLVPGRVTRLPGGVKLPHIGWNEVTPQYPHPLLEGLEKGLWGYFVHSYAAEAAEPADALALTEYGRVFPSMVARGNVMGAQFHPEKSSAAGIRIYANWLRLVAAWRGFTVFPAIDLKGGRAVRLRQGDFATATDYGDPVAAAERWLAAGARALHVVDLDGAAAGHPVNGSAVRAIVGAARRAGAVVQLGGGLRTLADMAAALDMGADRIVLGSAAVDPDLVREAVARFGPERVVAGIDARDGMVAVAGWTRTAGVAAVDLARSLRRAGVRHAVYTDIRRDGMLEGPPVDGVRELAATGLLVVASGGIASAADLQRLREIPGVSGAIVGKALYTGALDLAQALEAVT